MNNGDVVDDLLLPEAPPAEPPINGTDYYTDNDGGDTDDGGGGNVGMLIKVFAFVFCLCALAVCFYLSFSAQDAKRKAEVARIQAMREARLDGIKQMATEEETKRLSIIQAMKGRGMTITAMSKNGGGADAARVLI